MGWCSATIIFDDVCDSLLGEGKDKQSPEQVIRSLAVALEDGDWDCQSDSNYWGHPVVRKIMQELHRDWDCWQEDNP